MSSGSPHTAENIDAPRQPSQLNFYHEKELGNHFTAECYAPHIYPIQIIENIGGPRIRSRTIHLPLVGIATQSGSVEKGF